MASVIKTIIKIKDQITKDENGNVIVKPVVKHETSIEKIKSKNHNEN